MPRSSLSYPSVVGGVSLRTSKHCLTQNLLIVTFAFLALVSLQCEQPFDPMGPIDQRLVAFTVLSTDRDMQLVRVNAAVGQPQADTASFGYGSAVSDATVIIVEPGYYSYARYYWGEYVPPKEYILRDTVVSGSDAAGRTFSSHVMATRPLVPKYASRYYVYVGSNRHGNASGSVMMPGKPTLGFPWSTNVILNNPYSRVPSTPVDFYVTASSLAKGFIAHVWIEYDVLKSTEWVSELAELPLFTSDTASFGLRDPVYPTMVPCGSGEQFKVTYTNGYLQNLIKDITTVRYPSNKLIYTRVVLLLLQVDANLYSYIAASKVEGDPRSIRLDQPLYPTVEGGAYGMFGGYTVDSLVYLLPDEFAGNRR